MKTRNFRFDQMLMSRGPFYRKFCIILARKVARQPLSLPTFSDRDAALYRAGFVAGCEAVIEKIQEVDDPNA